MSLGNDYADEQWIHVRNVAIPMSYLYGLKFVGPITPLVLAIREVRNVLIIKKGRLMSRNYTFNRTIRSDGPNNRPT